MPKSTTIDVYPPVVADVSPIAHAQSTVRPTPCVVLPPVERVVGIGLPLTDDGLRRRRVALQQADRGQLLRVLNLAAAEKADTAEVEESHIVPESDWLHAYNSAPDSTAFGRARLREQREVA